jgi:hypothetical protein
MTLFIQTYLVLSIVLIPLNFFIDIFDLDIKFKACCVGITVLDVLWAICTLVCIIMAFIY